MDLSRRKFLSTLLATTAAVAIVPKLVKINDIKGEKDFLEYAWFVMGDDQPQMIQWSDVEDPTSWTTDNLRYSAVVHINPRYAMSLVPSTPFPAWVWGK